MVYNSSLYLEFELPSRFFWNLNKGGYYSLDGMNANGDDFYFYVASTSDSVLDRNLDGSGRLLTSKAQSLQLSETSPRFKLIAQDNTPRGFIVSTGTQTQQITLNSNYQNLKAVYIVHDKTDTVLAGCILNNSIPVKNYLTIPVEGQIVEVMPKTRQNPV